MHMPRILVFLLALTLAATLVAPALAASPPEACRDFRTQVNEANSLVVVAGQGVLPTIDYRGTSDATFSIKGTVCHLDLTARPGQSLRLVRFLDKRPVDAKQALKAGEFDNFEKLGEVMVHPGKDGTFVLAGLRPGSYAVFADDAEPSEFVVYDLQIVPAFNIASSTSLGLDPAPLSTAALQ
jgi:hypothetical protein